MSVETSFQSAELNSDKQSSVVIGNLLGVRIIGTGLCRASRVVRNEDLEQLGCDSEWIVQRTGIKSRFHIGPDESTSDLAIQASQECLADAGLNSADIDMIFVATMTPDHQTPSTSCLLQAALGANCGAIDVNSACSGFLYALVMAAQFVKTKSCRHVLVVGSEVMSSVVDPRDKKTYPLFGDGAAAAILALDETSDSQVDAADDAGVAPSGILAYQLASVGEMAHTLVVPAGGAREPFSQEVLESRRNYLEMDGRSVFKWAVRLIPDVVDRLLSATDLTLDDIDLIVPHQANRRIIDAAREDLGIPESKIFMNLERYGNTSAASVPICVHEAVQEGRIEPGNLVLLLGFGAGLTWAGALIRW